MAPILPPDIILLICEELGNQRAFGSLFNAALSGKNLAGSALLWMYRIHQNASIRGGSNEDEMRPGLGNTVDKWAMQWRSIILSSLEKTAYPYCLYIRSLDLANLDDLLNETEFKRSLYENFFAGGMEILLAGSDRASRRLKPRPLSSSVLNMVGESISKYAGESADRYGGTAALEELRGEIQKDSLPIWVRRLPRLKSLTLWNGFILNETVAEVIKSNCPEFESLTLFYGQGKEADSDFSSFFGGLRSNSLRLLQVISYHDVGPRAFLALNDHYASLKHLMLANLPGSAIKALPLLKGCSAIEILDLQDLDGRTDLAATDNDVLLEIIAWLTSCKQLKTISLKNFVNGPKILTAICLEESIHLENLLLVKYPLMGNQDFHRALAHQTSLISLDLKADPDDSFRDDIDTLVTSLCQLKNLKQLNILDISDYFKTSEVQLLAMHLSQLEEFTVGGDEITDEVWHAISTLPNLRMLSFHAITYFSHDRIINYISKLQSTNAGFQLSIMCAAAKSFLSDVEVQTIRDALAEKVNGKFEFVMYRDAESDFSSEMD